MVNKLHEIDSVYRNFELEIIGGDSNTVVQCRESGAMFEFDFAKVYWNPRLSQLTDFGILNKEHNSSFSCFRYRTRTNRETSSLWRFRIRRLRWNRTIRCTSVNVGL